MEADRQLFVQCSFWASFSLPPFPTLKMDSLYWQGQYLLKTFIFSFWKGQGFLRIRNLLNSCGSRTCSCLFGGAASPFAVCLAFVMLFAWLFACSRRKGKDPVSCCMHPRFACNKKTNWCKTVHDFSSRGMLWDRKLLYILSASLTYLCAHQ